MSDIKHRLLGHWGTTPGQNFIHAHLNRMIKKYDLDMIYVSDPGRGGPAVVANTYLEGTYSEIYPEKRSPLIPRLPLADSSADLSSYKVLSKNKLYKMITKKLIDTANALIADDRGLLAMDESNPTCNKRFAKLGIPETAEAHRAYRELIVTTPGLGESISGAILYDETIRQKTDDGKPFAKALSDAGIIAGIKVDCDTTDLAGHPGEKITEGLDGLRERLAEYSQMGARFAKWRAVIAINDCLPSPGCIEANSHVLAS